MSKRTALPCHYHSFIQIKIRAEETENEWTSAFERHTPTQNTRNLNTKYTINDSFNSIAWVNFQISFNITLKLCTSYSTGFGAGFSMPCLALLYFALLSSAQFDTVMYMYMYIFLVLTPGRHVPCTHVHRFTVLLIFLFLFLFPLPFAYACLHNDLYNAL